MCGFSGFYARTGVSEEVCANMTGKIISRGPDDSGIWVDHETGVILGHRRLSIQDTSDLGRQPMLSPSERYVVSYNGEIYNFKELKSDLESLGFIFKSESDTEVLLASIEAWGLQQSLNRFSGMFAFALWDKNEKMLTLARDRMGEKPIYYGWSNNVFVFGSELKALKAHPDWCGEIDRGALSLYMRHSYIPSPFSIYKGIYKLIPGAFIQFSVTDKSLFSPDKNLPESIQYWSARDVVERCVKEMSSASDSEATEELDKLLRKVVKERMISDVPLGAFLSGGVDSSVVASIMQQESEKPIKTFSIGFYEDGYNEAHHAKKIANHLGTDHTEMYVSFQQAIQVIPKLSKMYDEPFADSSQIPTYLVSKMAKKHVTVALSGDGGDEVFSGYNRYFLVESIWRKISVVPYWLVIVLQKILITIPPRVWDAFGCIFGLLVPSVRERTGDKLHKFASVLTAKTPENMYHRLVSHWNDPSSVVLNSIEPVSTLTNLENQIKLDGISQRMQFLDSISYLPDDILTKVDRASMYVSLEARVPLLSRRIFEFAWKLPENQKIKNGQSKWLLRQVLYKYVPSALIDRPKMGFGVPIDSWLRGPLRAWAEELLSEKRLEEDGFFDVIEIRKKWGEHLSGRRNWQHLLWNVLIFQMWLDEQHHS